MFSSNVLKEGNPGSNILNRDKIRDNWRAVCGELCIVSEGDPQSHTPAAGGGGKGIHLLHYQDILLLQQLARAQG
ncbi:hypothetical protein O3P69_019057 [Scylla paramamosain]|uniref:Uncharacterized protein n=1 Tax=Scylla paramamosain TaxID=85552 RepID=A0AAW0TAM0_SCYPA